MKFSIIKNNKLVVGQMTVDEYVDQVRTQVNGVLDYREILKRDKVEADARKSGMTAVTPSGTFVKCRNNDALDEYSGIICIDLDHIDTQGLDIENLNKDLTKDGFVCVVHKSVGGNGLAVFIKLDSGAEMHLSAFFQVTDYIQKKYGVKVDQSCKDIARQRYLSYDPDIYYNPQSAVFNVIDPGIFKDILEQIQFTENIQVMEEGSRNTFLHQLSCNCARAGVPTSELIKYCIPRYLAKDFPASEIMSTIESGYRQVEKDGDSRVFQTGQSAHNVESADSAVDDNDDLIINHNFEDDIFPKLPAFLQGFDQISNNRTQRDIILVSKLAMLSSCFPMVFTFYDGTRTYSNLFFLIYAPPASDKGKMSIIAKIAEPLDKLLSEECAKMKKAYNISCKTCGGDNNCLENLDAPKCKGMFLDADSSSIAMIQALDQGQVSLLIDSEAAVLSQNRRNDWGQLDPLLRKAYHFERISVSRKDKVITIRDPRISILISGTVEDAKVFSGSINGGLASRILPFSFRTPLEWQSRFTEESNKIPDFIDAKSKELIDLYNFSKIFPFEFKLTNDQEQLHTDTFTRWTDDLENEEVFAFIKRLGVATVRLAMILTALRRTERDNRESVIFCDDDLFEVALSIASTFRQQVLVFYKLLTKNISPKVPSAKMALTFLPKQFKTMDFMPAVKKVMNINERQAKFHLTKLVHDGHLSKISHGIYEKV